MKPRTGAVRGWLVLAAVAGCGGGNGGAASPPGDDGGSPPSMDGAGPRSDATADGAGGNGDGAAVETGSADGSSSGDDAPSSSDATGDDGGSIAAAVLSGTLVFSAVTGVDGADPPHQLFKIELGASQRAITPLAVAPNRGAWMPTFSHDGSQLFFTQVDQDPASPTNGQLLLVTAHADASNPTFITSCGASAPGGWRGPFCAFPSPGADGDVWYLLANKPPVTEFGQQVLHVSPTGGAMPTKWLDFPSDPTCAIYSLAMSPDRTRIAFVVGDSGACGAGRAGLYVAPIAATSIGTPITPGSALDTYTVPFTAFNRAGDRVYYIGVGSKLYSQKLDGTDAQLVCDADLSLQGDTGAAMAVVNDAYVVMGGAPGGIGAVPFVGAPGNGTFFVVAPAYGVDAVTWTP